MHEGGCDLNQGDCGGYMRAICAVVFLLGLMTLAAGSAAAQVQGTIRVTATVVDIREPETALQAARELAALAVGHDHWQTASSRRETAHGAVTLRPAPCGAGECNPAAVVTIVYW